VSNVEFATVISLEYKIRSAEIPSNVPPPAKALLAKIKPVSGLAVGFGVTDGAGDGVGVWLGTATILLPVDESLAA
jgi:hypothetical protein